VRLFSPGSPEHKHPDLSSSVLNVGKTSMELSFYNHFSSFLDSGVLVAFSTLSFDINFNLAVARDLVDRLNNISH